MRNLLYFGLLLLAIGSSAFSSSAANAETPPNLRATTTEHVVLLGQSLHITEINDIPTGMPPVIADENVCTAKALTKRDIVIIGKSIGTTTLTIAHENGTVSSIPVLVTHDGARLARLETTLKSILPSSNVKITMIQDSDKVLLSGTVCSCDDIKTVNALVESAQIDNEHIINKLTTPPCCVCVPAGGGRCRRFCVLSR